MNFEFVLIIGTVIFMLIIFYFTLPIVSLAIQPDRGVPQGPSESLRIAGVVPEYASFVFRINCVPSDDPVTTGDAAYECVWDLRDFDRRGNSSILEAATDAMDNYAYHVLIIKWQGRNVDNVNTTELTASGLRNRSQIQTTIRQNLSKFKPINRNYIRGKFTIHAPPEPGTYRLRIQVELEQPPRVTTTELRIWDRTNLDTRIHNVRALPTMLLTFVATVFGGVQLMIKLWERIEKKQT